MQTSPPPFPEPFHHPKQKLYPLSNASLTRSTAPGTSIPLSVSMKSAYPNSLVAGLYDGPFVFGLFHFVSWLHGSLTTALFKFHSFSGWILLQCTSRPQLLLSICSSLMDNWVMALWLLWMTICGSSYTCIPVSHLCPVNLTVPVFESPHPIPLDRHLGVELLCVLWHFLRRPIKKCLFIPNREANNRI